MLASTACPFYSFSFLFMKTSILSGVMSTVVDTPIKTKLTVEELQVRADTLLKRVGVTADQIHHAAAYQKKSED